MENKFIHLNSLVNLKKNGNPTHGMRYSNVSQISGLSRVCLRYRIYNKGWSVKKAVETPSNRSVK